VVLRVGFADDHEARRDPCPAQLFRRRDEFPDTLVPEQPRGERYHGHAVRFGGRAEALEVHAGATDQGRLPGRNRAGFLQQAEIIRVLQDDLAAALEQKAESQLDDAPQASGPRLVGEDVTQAS